MTTAFRALDRGAEFRLHPLGFFYLQDTAPPDTNWRIHVWLPGKYDHPELDKHQHSYDITSSIKMGRLKSEIFQFRSSADGTQREFAVSYEGDSSVLAPTGRYGQLELLSEFESAVGTSYHLRAGVIHRVLVLERPCVTTLLTRERGIGIYSYGEQLSEPPFARRLVDTAEARQIDEVLRASFAKC